MANLPEINHPLFAVLVEALSAKLSKAGDTSTGQQVGPNGITPSSFITQQQVAQGVKRPLLYAAGVTSTNTALSPTLVDPLGLARPALILKVYLFMTGSPGLGLGTTIKIGTTPGGNDILNKVYLLAGLPGLNTLLELNQPTAVTIPTGSTLYATSSGGTWTVLVDCFYIN